jgi:hypothetical protein
MGYGLFGVNIIHLPMLSADWIFGLPQRVHAMMISAELLPAVQS